MMCEKCHPIVSRGRPAYFVSNETIDLMPDRVRYVVNQIISANAHLGNYSEIANFPRNTDFISAIWVIIR